LDTLRDVDPSAWERKTMVLTTDPGIDKAEVVTNLRRRSLNSDLTLQDVDEAYNEGNLSQATYNTFLKDLKHQKKANYSKAIEYLRSERGVPEGTYVNFGPVQQTADNEVAQIRADLILALDNEPNLDPLEFVKKEIANLVEEKGSTANAALRQQASRLAAELRIKLPGASAQELLDQLQSNPEIYPNPRKRRNAVENLLPVLIEIEANQ